MSTNTAVLLLGSNLGDREANIVKAINYLIREGCEIVKSSNNIRTEAVEFASGNYFINFAAIIRTGFSPIQLLKSVKSIEREMGREADSAVTGGYQDRVIDIDIVFYNNINFRSKILEIPHRRHLGRDFSQRLLRELEM